MASPSEPKPQALLSYNSEYDPLDIPSAVYFQHTPPSTSISTQPSLLPLSTPGKGWPDARMLDQPPKGNFHPLIRSKVKEMNNLFIVDWPPECQGDIIKKLDTWIETYDLHTSSIDIDRILRSAIWRRQLFIVKNLVEERGAQVAQLDILGRSAIFYAAKGPLAIFEYVFLHLSDDLDTRLKLLNAQDSNGETPLHHTRPSTHHDSHTVISKFLLAEGADPSIKSKKGETAADLFERLVDSKGQGHGNCEIFLLCASRRLANVLQDTRSVTGQLLEVRQGPSPKVIAYQQSIGQFLGKGTPWRRSKDYLNWVHVPFTNVGYGN